MPDSEDEAYDPWPSCIMDMTGCHCGSYYSMKYNLSATLTTFLKIDPKTQMNWHEMDNAILEYADKHAGFKDTTFNYDADLWDLLGLNKNNIFKFYQIQRYIEKHATKADPPVYFGTSLADLDLL